MTALVLILFPHACWASLVINEFLPDPDGSDGGREFVELLNTGPEVESLSAVVLQFANGAEGPVWSTRWTGTPGDQLVPGGRFLIVDRNWMGVPDGQEEVYLGLQNGPDAVRLARGSDVLDLVGYGPLTDPAMKEGDPAEISPGKALARRPDGQDTGDNHSDFVLTEPTPGAPNFFPFSLKVDTWELDPPSVDRVLSSVRFTVDLVNDGTETLPTGPILLRFGNVIRTSLLDGLPAGGQRRISWNLVPPVTGLWPLEVLVPLPVDQDTLALHPASLQVGPGDLMLNEVMAAPGQGQGEWVEIGAVGGQGVDLEGYALRDHDGSWRRLPDLRLGAGELLVLAQDSLSLATWHLDNRVHGAVTGCPVDLAISRQRHLLGWPNLNNTPTSERVFADRVYLSNPFGDVIDHLTFGDGESLTAVPAVPGLSLERLAEIPRNPAASNWAPCTALTGSTPGCGNSVATTAGIPSDFTVQPPVLDPASGVSTVHFLFTLTEPQAAWELRVFDLWGGLVRDLGTDSMGPGPRDMIWDGRDDQGRLTGSGGYVGLLEIRDRDFQCLSRNKVLLVIR